MANGLLVWSEGESLESTVSNLPWFMVCLFHETGKKRGEGSRACDTCKQAWRWVPLLWIDSLLLRLLWWTMRSLRLRDQLLFHGFVVFKRNRKKISLDKTASRFAKRRLNYICQRKGLSFISETQFQALVAVKIKELHGNNPIELQKHKPFVHMQPCCKCKSVVWAWLQQRFTQKHLENCSYYCDDYCNYSHFNSGQNVDSKRVQG